MPGFIVGLIITLHISVCICLMASILLQSGKGGGLAGTFGAGSSQTLFGGRGAATFLSRATTTLAVIFFITSLTLGLQASRSATGGRSLIQEDARRRGQQRTTQTPGAGAPEPTGAQTSGAPNAGPPAAPATGSPAAPRPVTPGAPASGASNPAPPPGNTGNGTQEPATGGK